MNFKIKHKVLQNNSDYEVLPVLNTPFAYVLGLNMNF